MDTIIKVNLRESAAHEIPQGALALDAQYMDEGLCVWLMCNPRKRLIKTLFYIAGTGWQMPHFVEPEMHVATVLNKKKKMVWHIFMLGYEDSLSPVDLARAYETNGAQMEKDLSE